MAALSTLTALGVLGGTAVFAPSVIPFGVRLTTSRVGRTLALATALLPVYDIVVNSGDDGFGELDIVYVVAIAALALNYNRLWEMVGGVMG